MDLSISEEEAQIGAMTAAALRGEAPLARWFAPDVDAAADAQRLGALAGELGWIGFGAPEALGGSGAPCTEEAMLFREIGRWLGPVSITAGAVGARLASGRDADTARAVVEARAEVGLLIGRQNGMYWRLGAASGELGLLADGGSVALMRGRPGVPKPCFDPTTAAQVVCGSLQVVAQSSAFAELGRWMLLIGAQQLGLAEAALAASVEYARLREQFGRPIGAFQAVRHRCVDMAMRNARATAQLCFAAVCLRDGAPDARFQVLAAARVCEDAASRNARDNIFTHGAIGVTAENAAHLFLKRSILWRQALPPRGLLESIAGCCGLQG